MWVRCAVVLLMAVVAKPQAVGGGEWEGWGGREVVVWPVLEEVAEFRDASAGLVNHVVDGSLIDRWLAALNRPEAGVRREAAGALRAVVVAGEGGWGEREGEVVVALRGALGDEDRMVRLAAAGGLAEWIAVSERDEGGLPDASSPPLSTPQHRREEVARELLALMGEEGRGAWGSEAMYVEAVRVVDPALVACRYEPAWGAWLDRLWDRSLPTAARVSAAASLGAWGGMGEGGRFDMATTGRRAWHCFGWSSRQTSRWR